MKSMGESSLNLREMQLFTRYHHLKTNISGSWKNVVKPILTLTQAIYREFVGIIWLSQDVSVSDVRNVSHKHLLYQKGTLFPL